MTSRHEELRAAVARLHRELEDLDQVESQDRRLLEAALADIQAKLAADAAEESHTLLDDLKESARRFEQSHPNLSGAIGGVIDAIGRMGI